MTARRGLVHRARVRSDELWLELAAPESIAEGAPLAACEALLSDEERERAARLRAPAARHGFVVAHALLRSALSDVLARAPGSWQFRAGARGKPELVGMPEAAQLGFSLSHTGGLVACALAWRSEVGVDVESGARLGDPLRLAERFFAPEEAAQLCALPEAERRERFLDAWVVKEALLKAKGLGIAGALRSVVALPPGSAPPGVAFTAGFGDDPRRWQLERLRPTPEHRVAVAVARGAGADLALRVRFGGALPASS